ncbi:hypothetical protein CDV50_15945 [Haematobacter massiliensis]|uniref:hypothetical protein n=1 Tax=Haematobacter massiliensis TaxID=195105 RepID=UPI000B49CBF4|nr:hypothetical protein [Haematobacter massiliensis]OWJ69812.1 hypothetical protein CDV50_15945 [Haematobacter massiliensis]
MAALLSDIGYSVEQLSVTKGQYTTSDTETARPFTATSTDGTLSISGIMPPGAQMIYTDDPQRQALIYLPAGGTVTVDSRTPATTADEYGRTIHGSTLNPTEMNTTTGIPPHGYDQRARFNDTRVNVTFSASRVAQFPLSMAVNDTCVFAKSAVPLPMGGKDSYIDEYFSLTVLAGSPPSSGLDLFAPPVVRSTPQPALEVDIDAIYASLPRYSADGTSPPVENFDTNIGKIEKFQASLRGNFGSQVAGVNGGYGDFMPRNSGIEFSNYGRALACVQTAVFPILYTDAADEAMTKRLIRAVLSYGRQVDNTPTGPNGGIWTFSFPMAYLYRHWTGQDLSRFVMGAKGVAPMDGGNILGQFFEETPANLLRYTTPHRGARSSPDPVACRLRAVLAVSGQTIRLDNSGDTNSGKYMFRDLILRNEAGTKSALILGPTPSNTPTTGADKDTMTLTLSGTNNFSVGEDVWMDGQGLLSDGDPNWAVRWRELSGVHQRSDGPNTDAGGGYRNLTTGSDFLLCAQALGIANPTWRPLVRYTEYTLPAVGQPIGTWPSTRPFAHAFKSDVDTVDNPIDPWGMRLWRKHWSALKNKPQLGA